MSVLEQATCPLCSQRAPVMYHVPHSDSVGIAVHAQFDGGPLCMQREARYEPPPPPRSNAYRAGFLIGQALFVFVVAFLLVYLVRWFW